MKPNSDNPILEKKIKKNIYGKAQTIAVHFPPGFGNVALTEVESILQNLWFPQKWKPLCTLLENEIYIQSIHLSAAYELLLRTTCITDIRLIIFKGKAFGKHAVQKCCESVNWLFYLHPTMTIKIKVNSVASKAFHETALKKIVSEIISNYQVKVSKDEDATTCLYVTLYKDKLTLSISLAGAPLYKRGYRTVLSQSAPLREDIAASCIQKAIKFSKKMQPFFSPSTVLVPFAGTGTFVFEFFIQESHFSSILFGREYALQYMPLFKPKLFNFLRKKARENCYWPSTQFICIDHSSSAQAAWIKNKELLQTAVLKQGLPFSDQTFSYKHLDFFATDFLDFFSENDVDDIFIPLNPPYGIRLNKQMNVIHFYKRIALKINQLSHIVKKNKKNLTGFILAPNEATWSVFCKNLTYSAIETYHMTQGGIDIRVCQFFI